MKVQYRDDALNRLPTNKSPFLYTSDFAVRVQLDTFLTQTDRNLTLTNESMPAV